MCVCGGCGSKPEPEPVCGGVCVGLYVGGQGCVWVCVCGGVCVCVCVWVCVCGGVSAQSSACLA